jgi:hypothetical protein
MNYSEKMSDMVRANIWFDPAPSFYIRTHTAPGIYLLCVRVDCTVESTVTLSLSLSHRRLIIPRGIVPLTINISGRGTDELSPQIIISIGLILVGLSH